MEQAENYLLEVSKAERMAVANAREDEEVERANGSLW